MSPLAPPALVTGAARVAIPYGLFSTFSLRPGGDRWENGISFELDTTDPVSGIGQPTESNEVQSLTEGGAGLVSFTLTLGGQTTAAIPAAATAAQVQSALGALSTVGSNNVSVSGPASGPYSIKFINALANTDVAALTTTPTGGTGTTAVATTTPGVVTLGLPKTLGQNWKAFGSATPLTVYGHFTGSPVSWTALLAQEKAVAHLQSREENRVEQAFWTGDLGNSPKLQDPAVTTVQAAAGSIDRGLAVLEDFIATNYGSLGVIHMSRGTAASLMGRPLLTVSGGRLFTALGTPVAAGAGYPETGPTGQAAAPGTAWVFATPAIFGYRSEVFTSSNRAGDLLDRSNNNLFAVAERTYLLGFDPTGVAAALINLP